MSDTASGMPRREELDEVLELVAREATTYLRGVDARNARMPHAARAAASFVAPLPDEGVGATVALRELLKLYGDVADPTIAKQVEGVKSVKCRPITRRLPVRGPITFGRGLEIAVTFDELAFEGRGIFVLGAVLEQFFAKYVSINSFTELVVDTVDRGEVGCASVERDSRWRWEVGRLRAVGERPRISRGVVTTFGHRDLLGPAGGVGPVNQPFDRRAGDLDIAEVRVPVNRRQLDRLQHQVKVLRTVPVQRSQVKPLEDVQGFDRQRAAVGAGHPVNADVAIRTG